jgi:pimeloyl-ACP methyl ester carboxylesterase
MADLAARHADDGRIKAVFLICPPIKMKFYLNFFAAVADLVPFVQTEDGFRVKDEEMYFGAAARKLRDIQRAAKAALNGASSISCPVMLVEAENDSRVDPKSYELLEKKLRDHSRVMIPGAPHGIPYSEKRGELCAIFEDFLKKYE